MSKIIFDSARLRHTNRFGRGLVVTKAASDVEAREHFLATTVSPAEHFARLIREATARWDAQLAKTDRVLDAKDMAEAKVIRSRGFEEAEPTEVGVVLTPDELEAAEDALAAEEEAEMDRLEAAHTAAFFAPFALSDAPVSLETYLATVEALNPARKPRHKRVNAAKIRRMALQKA